MPSSWQAARRSELAATSAKHTAATAELPPRAAAMAKSSLCLLQKQLMIGGD